MKRVRAQISLDSLIVILISLLFFVTYLLNWSHVIPYSSKSGLIIRLKNIAQLINISYQYVQHNLHCLNNNLSCYIFFIPENIHMLIVNSTPKQYIVFFGTGFLSQLLEIPGNITAILQSNNVSDYCYYANGSQVVTYTYQAMLCYANYPNGTTKLVPAYHCFCRYPGVSGTGGLQYFELPTFFSGIYGILWNIVAGNGFTNTRHMIIVGAFTINESCKAKALAELLRAYLQNKDFACKDLVDSPLFSECLGIYIVKRCAVPSDSLGIVMVPLNLTFNQLFPGIAQTGNTLLYSLDKRVQPVPDLYVTDTKLGYFAVPNVTRCTVNLTTGDIYCVYRAKFYNLINTTFAIQYYAKNDTTYTQLLAP